MSFSSQGAYFLCLFLPWVSTQGYRDAARWGEENNKLTPTPLNETQKIIKSVEYVEMK